MSTQVFNKSKPLELSQHTRDLSFSSLYKDMFENTSQSAKGITKNTKHLKRYANTIFSKEILPSQIRNRPKSSFDKNPRIKSARPKSLATQSINFRWRSHSPSSDSSYSHKSAKSSILYANKPSLIVVPAILTPKAEKAYMKSMQILYTRAKGKIPQPPSSPLKFNLNNPSQRKFRPAKANESSSNSFSIMKI